MFFGGGGDRIILQDNNFRSTSTKRFYFIWWYAYRPEKISAIRVDCDRLAQQEWRRETDLYNYRY